MMALEHVKNSPHGTQETAIVGKNVFVFTKEQNGQVTVCMMQEDSTPSPAVPVQAFLDWMKQNKGSNVMPVTGTSFAAEYVAAICAKIGRRVQQLIPNGEIPKADRPKLIKAMLERMAKPFGNHQPWEIGEGLVTQSIAESYLKSMDVKQVRSLHDQVRNRW